MAAASSPFPFTDGVDETGSSGLNSIGSFPDTGLSSQPQSLYFEDDAYIANHTFTSSPAFPVATDAVSAALYSSTAAVLSVAVSNFNETVSDDGSEGLFGSSFHLRHSIPVTVFLSFLAGVVSIVTVLGNLLVLVAFFVDRTLRQPGNYLIVSLASADLLIGVFSMPLYTMYLLLDESWPLGWVACDLWLSLDYAVCLVSQYTVFYITLDRFLVVKFTATYRLWLTNKRAKLIVTGIWIGSWLLFFPSITGWQFFVGERTVPPTSCYAQFMENPLFNTILVILYYWVTLFVISILYTFIYRKAWEMEARRKAEHKRAQMVHLKLAQAALGRLGTASAPRSPSKLLKPPTPSPIGKNSNNDSKNGRRDTLDTSDDDDNKSSTSSHSWLNKKQLKASKKKKNNNNTKNNARNLFGLSKLRLPVSPPPPNTTPVKSNNCNNNKSPVTTSHKFLHRELSNNTTTTVNLEAPLLRCRNDSENSQQRQKGVLSKLKKKNQHPEKKQAFTRATSSPPEERLVVSTITDDTAVATLAVDETKDDLAVADAAPVTTMRRSYSDLEPVLTVGGLLRIPVDEVIGIEYIDDDPIHSSSATPCYQPFSGNAIYRLRLDPAISKKSCTFENLPSARTEKTIRQRIDRLLKRTRRRVSHHGVLFASLLRLRNGGNHNNSNTTDGSGDGNNNNKNNGTAIKFAQMCCTESSSSDRSNRPKVSGEVGRFPNNNNNNNNNNNKHSNALASPNKTAALSTANYQSRAHKALRMISFILGIFVITWTPYHILAIMKGFCNECVNDTLYAISYWFCYLNSPINPICYAVANKHFKRAFSKILHGNFK